MQIKILGEMIEISKHTIPNILTSGVSNRTQDGFYVLFADYDECNLKVVEEDAEFLQQHYDIGDILILRSSETANQFGEPYGNYHMIGFTKHIFPEILKLLEVIRCDPHFKRGWKYQNRSWVLRTTDKVSIAKRGLIKNAPTFCSFMPSPSRKEYSKGLVTFFTANHNFKFPRNNRKFDKIEFVELISYPTK